jgi:hypothetical protein
MNSVRLTGVAAWNAAGEPAEVHGLSERRVRQAVFRVLKSNVLGAMATVAPDGRAHIHTCYFSYTQALELFFLSHPRSQHCRNLLANPSTAVAVFSSSQQWTGPDRGLQLFGNMRGSGRDWRRAMLCGPVPRLRNRTDAARVQAVRRDGA